MYSIQFIHLNKSYGDVKIFSDFSMDVAVGSITALVGESGSGKSTLLMLSNGLLSADSGDVQVLGKSLKDTDLLILRRQIGYAVQGAGLFPHLTVRQNVSLIATLEGWSEDRREQRMGTLFDMLNLDVELLERYPYGLSGGQQQRMSLCRAMMLEPPLLLLDEPFSALDPLTRRSIYKELLKVQSLEPRSILLVTHDMQEAIRLADQIVILKEGRVVQQGDVQQVVSSPADDYVRTLLGENP